MKGFFRFYLSTSTPTPTHTHRNQLLMCADEDTLFRLLFIILSIITDSLNLFFCRTMLPRCSDSPIVQYLYVLLDRKPEKEGEIEEERNRGIVCALKCIFFLSRMERFSLLLLQNTNGKNNSIVDLHNVQIENTTIRPHPHTHTPDRLIHKF